MASSVPATITTTTYWRRQPETASLAVTPDHHDDVFAPNEREEELFGAMDDEDEMRPRSTTAIDRPYLLRRIPQRPPRHPPRLLHSPTRPSGPRFRLPSLCHRGRYALVPSPASLAGSTAAAGIMAGSGGDAMSSLRGLLGGNGA
ncbi:hypothetical protein LTR56_008511 [Elasticomyces elasticus]|nr:hypothetical protein LTR56_008511 [Elasticomyces elasticus]KAK3668944.1 hypothetical protein LTR22_000022 [Elasticomyces elasticus]KAK4914719.1 hypothetical protein LTR49_017061 [Elasticomyces elasticus]KAK5759214.1 hypothetical protein LTS12_010683 [Elasticomyces elasticus]